MGKVYVSCAFRVPLGLFSGDCAAGQRRKPTKLWQSCTIRRDIATKLRAILANLGALDANTLHTLTGFPGLGM